MFIDDECANKKKATDDKKTMLCKTLVLIRLLCSHSLILTGTVKAMCHYVWQMFFV